MSEVDRTNFEQTVLVVEDDPSGARLVREWLGESTRPVYVCAVARRLSEALVRVESEDFDVIIVDLGLPDAMGMEAVDALVKASPTSALVVLSGNDDEELALQAVSHGCQDFLVKDGTEGRRLRLALHYAAERKTLALALVDSEARFRDLVDAASDWYWETGPDARFTSVSSAFEAVTGVPAAEVLGKTREEIAFVDAMAQEWQEFLQTIQERKPFQNFEYRFRVGGGDRYCRCSGKPVFDAKGQFRGYRGVGSDITEYKQMVERIRHLAHYDPLTNLPNRALFQDRLQMAAAQCKRRPAVVAILYLDLDGFKAVNDEFGHDAGDELLKVVADRLSQCIRDGDTLARLGGDEFAIIAEVHTANAVDEIKAIGQRILDRLAVPIGLAQGEARISASIGGSFFPPDSADIDGCLRLSDMCMYVAKRTGKNKLVISQAEGGDDDPSMPQVPTPI
jgi:diguanylate cyclase (GGDEF)-like protein/PAS domain S-box-containing protein